ncbi:hypothetical protein QP179_14230 [Sphingomonas aurantiaca]|uniref:hypothetical protein n=1 Tax=Sphingomonas aurantiaca TaxID=185949 RepID=UPI002FDF0B90
MTLRTRLARLETVNNSTSRIIVVDGPKGLHIDTVLREHSVVATDRDLVVVIADPVGTAASISVTVDGAVVISSTTGDGVGSDCVGGR